MIREQNYSPSKERRWHRFLTLEARLSVCGNFRRAEDTKRRLYLPEDAEPCKKCLSPKRQSP